MVVEVPGAECGPILLPQEVLRRKRDGAELTAAEIGFLVAGVTSGDLVDAQVGAFAMAVACRGMSRAETVALTVAMRDSGRVLDWSGLPGPVVDKHSTGGVGDKVSLVLTPILAACGCFVPMLSGRGLGHTGGTLDKLESIHGYDTRPEIERLRRVVADVGCCIVGQTHDLAPADRRLYAIRDVTGTVESIPLITASILSKKLAAGPQALVMDVKVGSGAFLPDVASAGELAATIVDVAAGAGLACRALLTDMDQCLGRSAGNALELAEVLAMLRGQPVEPRLRAVTLALAVEALVMAGRAETAGEGERRAARALDSGAAAERFARMVAALGGPRDLVERPQRHLRPAPVIRPVMPPRPGSVAAIDVRRLGLAIVAMGGGRRQPGDLVDHRVGLTEVRGIGEACGDAIPLAVVHARDEAGWRIAAAEVAAAFAIEDHPATPPPAIRARLPAA